MMLKLIFFPYFILLLPFSKIKSSASNDSEVKTMAQIDKISYFLPIGTSFVRINITKDTVSKPDLYVKINIPNERVEYLYSAVSPGNTPDSDLPYINYKNILYSIKICTNNDCSYEFDVKLSSDTKHVFLKFTRFSRSTITIETKDDSSLQTFLIILFVVLGLIFIVLPITICVIICICIFKRKKVKQGQTIYNNGIYVPPGYPQGPMYPQGYYNNNVYPQGGNMRNLLPKEQIV